MNGKMTNGLDALPERVERLADKVDRLADKVDRLDLKVDRLDGKVDRLEHRVDGLEQRVVGLDRKVDVLSASVDRRFDEVSEAIAEQRRYTEFAVEQLDGSMREGFDRVRGEMTEQFALVHDVLRVMSAKLDRAGGA